MVVSQAKGLAKDRDGLELLRKEAPDVDLDFLGEGLRVLSSPEGRGDYRARSLLGERSPEPITNPRPPLRTPPNPPYYSAGSSSPSVTLFPCVWADSSSGSWHSLEGCWMYSQYSRALDETQSGHPHFVFPSTVVLNRMHTSSPSTSPKILIR